jgi:hypothetical protein
MPVPELCDESQAVKVDRTVPCNIIRRDEKRSHGASVRIIESTNAQVRRTHPIMRGMGAFTVWAYAAWSALGAGFTPRCKLILVNTTEPGHGAQSGPADDHSIT